MTIWFILQARIFWELKEIYVYYVRTIDINKDVPMYSVKKMTEDIPHKNAKLAQQRKGRQETEAQIQEWNERKPQDDRRETDLERKKSIKLEYPTQKSEYYGEEADASSACVENKTRRNTKLNKRLHEKVTTQTKLAEFSITTRAQDNLFDLKGQNTCCWVSWGQWWRVTSISNHATRFCCR